MKRDRELERYKRLAGMLYGALEDYANPEFYHACAILCDPPGGGIDKDFGTKREHKHPDYDRPMPGKLARATLRKAKKQYGNLTMIYHERD